MTTDPRVHVVSCVGAERDRDLLEHFVDHYARLGVARENMHVIAHADQGADEALAALVETFQRLGLEPAMTWRGTYTSGAMWQRRRGVQRRQVPAGAWVLSADVDELHVYPAPLGEVLDHLEDEDVTVLQGPMIDRVGPDGELLAVAAKPSLAEQFPVVAEVMCHVGGIESAEEAEGTVKVMLCRSEVLPGLGGHAPWRNSHGPWRTEGLRYAAGRPLADFPGAADAAWRFAQPAAVHHYKWTAGVAEAVRRRREARGASERGSAYGSAVADYVESHGGRIALDDVAVARTEEFTSRWKRVLGRRSEQPDLAPRTEDWRRTLAEQRSSAPPLPGAVPAVRGLRDQEPVVAEGWRVRRLTEGTPAGSFHSHSYYDIPVLDDTGAHVVAHRMTVQDRWMTSEDRVAVGVVDRVEGGFTPLAETRAWSWQQGPLAQWVPGTRSLVWNDRDGDTFTSRLHDLGSGTTRSLPRSVYALAPDGATAMSLDMARLSRARPGYGYFGGRSAGAESIATSVPSDEGVWEMPLDGGPQRLVLSLAEAVDFLHSQLADEDVALLRSAPHLYWFNHVKFSPDGRRFTVKLRWRIASLERPWRGPQSASLTGSVAGGDLRFLCRAASHVMWVDDEQVVCWDEMRERLAVIADDSPRGRLLRDLPTEVFGGNVHIHPLREPGTYLYDVPYAETVQLRHFSEQQGDQLLAQMSNHLPVHGPFRCDLHPVPDATGDVTVFTSLHDGGRQVYVLERED